MATRSSGSSRNARKVSPISRDVWRSMALAFGRSSVTSRIAPSRRVLTTSDMLQLPCLRCARGDQQRVGDPGALPFRADDQRIDVQFLDEVGMLADEAGNAQNRVDGGGEVAFRPPAIAVEQRKQL